MKYLKYILSLILIIGTPTVTQAEVIIHKTHSPAFVRGQQATYLFSVYNDMATVATVTDTLPPGVTYVSANSITGWTIDHSNQVVTATSNGTAGDSSFTVTVAIATDATSPLFNTANITDGVSSDSDIDVGQIGEPMFQIKKTASLNPAINNGSLDYNVVVKNIGNAATIGPITITDMIPEGFFVTDLNFGDFNIRSGNDEMNNFYFTTSDALLPGDSIQFSIGGSVFLDDIGAGLTNIITVEGGGALESKTDEEFTDVIDGPLQGTLSIIKSHEPETFSVGQVGAFLLTVLYNDNSGAIQTNDTITVIDTLPKGLSFVSGGGDGWTVTAQGQIVTATTENTFNTFDRVPQILILVKVSDHVSRNLINTATVSGGGTVSTDSTIDEISIFKGKTIKNKFASQTTFLNKLKWGRASAKVTGYLLYRNDDLIAEISANGPFHFNDRPKHQRKKYVYKLITLGQNGEKSVPATVTLR